MLEYQRVERQTRTVLEMKLLKPLPPTNKKNWEKKKKKKNLCPQILRALDIGELCINIVSLM